MKINYNVTGAQRKSLVGAISQELNMPTEYLGVPTFAYKIGGFTIDRNGVVTGADNRELVASLQSIHSFTAISEEYDAPLPEVAETLSFEESPAPEYPSGIDSLVIELPKDGFTDIAIANLEKLMESKSALIKKAVGADNLTIEQTENTLRFPWFKLEASPDEIKAYTHFVSTLCTLAKEQKRVTAKEKPIDNEKYAFRCFLLRLGFIGENLKSERKILLANLSGNGSFKCGEHKIPDTAAPIADNGETTASADISISQETNADKTAVGEAVAL